jgi:cytochrome c5
MNRKLIAVAVMSLVLGACGKSEEPKEAEQAGSDAAAPPPMQSGQAADTAAMPEASGADSAGAMSDMETTAQEAMSQAEEAVAKAEETVAAMTPAPSAGAANGEGKKAYDQICFACHAQGVAGAPVFGDKAAWAPRIAQGMDTLYTHAINGFQGTAGVMPPKGGMPSLSDEQVKAAVDYIVENAK